MNPYYGFTPFPGEQVYDHVSVSYSALRQGGSKME
jgi:hypothetical protein